jgi:hypothetical protein
MNVVVAVIMSVCLLHHDDERKGARSTVCLPLASGARVAARLSS